MSDQNEKVPSQEEQRSQPVEGLPQQLPGGGTLVDGKPAPTEEQKVEPPKPEENPLANSNAEATSANVPGADLNVKSK